MQTNDNVFFEEYKRLEKLCSEIFSCTNGVSAYIEAMESEFSLGLCLVRNWESDFKMLKHVRWVRNQIAHDFSGIPISEPHDLSFVRSFYCRIFSCEDPLSLLRKAKEAKAAREPRQKISVQNPVSVIYPAPGKTPVRNHSKRWIAALIAAIAVFLAIAAVCLLR